MTQRYDSETDPTADPDTDATGDSVEQSLTATPPNKMQHSLHGVGISGLTGGGGIGPRSSQQHSSFKRPVMGNRGLETRQSKRSQQHPCREQSSGNGSITTNGNGSHLVQPAHTITVGALEEMNVKRVVNRYGTLPKKVRIGAYLDGLENSSSSSSGGGGGGISECSPVVASGHANGHATPPARAPPPNVPSAVAGKSQPTTPQQMIRSNSSGGVTMQNNAAASLNKLQRHRTTTEGTMMTFSSFRAAGSSNSPKRGGAGGGGGIAQAALANLEFPPPPLEEFEALPPPPPPPAPESAVQAIQQHLHAQHSSSNDVSNTAPSVEEASSRFGVSLRKREPSTDSCSSLGTPPEPAPAPVAVTAAPMAAEKSLNLKEKLITEIKSANNKPSDMCSGYANGSAPVPAPASASAHHAISVDPVAQLVTELAESMNLPKPTTKLTNGNISANSNSNNNFKAQLKKVEPKKMNTPMPKAEQPSNIIDFKAHLRKVDKDNKEQQQQQQPNANPNPNSNNKFSSATAAAAANQKTEIKIDVSSNSNADAEANDSTTAGTTESGKRRSTGSINSLKKLWEQPPGSGSNGGGGGDYASTTIPATAPASASAQAQLSLSSSNGTAPPQLSPRYGQKVTLPVSATVTSKLFGNTKPPPAAPPPPPPISTNPAQSKQSQSQPQQQKQQQPQPFATSNKKSTTIKTSLSTQLFTDAEVNNSSSSSSGGEEQQPQQQTTLEGMTPSELMTQSLYGSEQLQQTNNKLSSSSSSSNGQNKPAVPHKPTKLTIYATPIAKIAGIGVGGGGSGSDSVNSTQISRESILELVNLLEGSLKHPVNAISASQWLQLSDKLNILQNSCVVFAENESMPPHSKFHFRELVTRVETQSQNLRTAGSKNVQDNERLVGEVGQSLKQISNALHR